MTFESANRCIIVTGSALDSYSSVKVWDQHSQFGILDDLSSLYLEIQPVGCQQRMNIVMALNIPSLMDNLQAWYYVMQFMKGEVKFILLTKKLVEIGYYKHEDWKILFNQLFNLSEDNDVMRAIAAIETMMGSHGLSLGSEPTDQHPMPRPSNALERHWKTSFWDTENLPSPKCHKVDLQEGKISSLMFSQLGSPRQWRRGQNIRKRMKWEGELSAGPSSLPHKSYIYPVPGPSRYAQVINAMSQCYEIDEELESLLLGSKKDINFEVLDDISLWMTISDWLSGALNFKTLMYKLDFQHSKCAEIELAFESNLNKREEKFKVISFSEHHQRLTTYKAVSDQLLHFSLPDPRSPLYSFTSSNIAEQVSLGLIKIWSVKIVPISNFHYKANSAKYLARVWNNVNFKASITEGLPGCSFTLMSTEKCISINHIFSKVHVIPACYCYVAGLLLIQLPKMQVCPFPTCLKASGIGVQLKCFIESALLSQIKSNYPLWPTGILANVHHLQHCLSFPYIVWF
ncbi:hypothetical protein HD554DRAFT_2040077 [Boletus coccyginus]|nr:hypothetical protein HD554DRAFT_2040077 [Boletus coccyginus]